MSESPSTKVSRPAGATKSPFAHRATGAPFAASAPAAAVATPAAGGKSASAAPARRSLLPYYFAGAVLALGAGAYGWSAGGEAKPVAGSDAMAPRISAEAMLGAAEAECRSMRELAKRVGADKSEGELMARAAARVAEAAALTKAGKPGEAAAAFTAGAERFAEAAGRVRRMELERALAAVPLKDVREYRAELWRMLDSKSTAAAAAVTAGRFVVAAPLYDEAASSVAACVAASREELRKLALEAEAAGQEPATKALRFKLARLAPDDAANTDWLMRRGRAAGELVRDALGIPFVYAPPATYAQGSPETEAGRKADETVRRVTLTRGFFLALTEVTQAQWDAVMGAGDAAARLAREPAAFRGADLPVVNVSWAEAQEFCRKLSGKTGRRYRLPTEAEWEYACRAGQAGPFGSEKLFLGAAEAVLDDGTRTAPVAPKPVASTGAPNAWGLRDMHGNAWEWCSDWYAARPASPATDPTGPGDAEAARSDTPMKVARGGSWNDPAAAARSANRWSYPASVRVNYIGLRPVLEFSADAE